MTNSIAALHAVPTDPSFVDLEAAERAAADLIQALGADTESESLEGTPRRIAAMYAELLSPVPFDATTFPNDGGYDELVVAREIQFHSLCEHHLLPFTGVAHVAYLPGERILGLSKLARVVDYFARSLQVQERLTTQVAGWLQRELEPKGVGVVIEAEHLVHVAARSAEAGREDRHVRAARTGPRRRAHAPGVPLAGALISRRRRSARRRS